MPLDNIRKILVIRRDNIGDLLCTTPMLSLLRKRYPDAHIAVLANSYNAPILKDNPDVDRIYAYTKAKHSDGSKLAAWWREWSLFRALKKEHFDLIIHANPTPHPRTAKLVKYLKPGDSLGVDGGEAVYTLPIKQGEIRGSHHVEQVCSLLRPLTIDEAPGPLTLVPETPYSANTPRVVGIHLSSRKPNNRWPESYYCELIHRLLEDHYRIRLFWAPGSENDPHHPGNDEMAGRIEQQFSSRVEPVATSTLKALIDEMNRCDLMVCPDGGTMHIAAALQKPLVALFGCTPAETWGPWSPVGGSIILNGYGNAADISVNDTYQALARLVKYPV